MPDVTPALEVRLKLSLGKERPFELDLAFTARPGISILFGPSGAGKSTTLQAIAGMIRPDAGRIALGDEVWFDSATGAQTPVHRRQVAYVFQTLALFPHLSVLENVGYGIARSVPRPERERRAREMLERMKVGHVTSRRPRTLSGGEAQRVALARAFAMQPRVVLLDEPFSALDRALRLQLVADVRAWADEARLPVLHVTHHRNEARALGDHVILLEEGRVKDTGDAARLLPSLDDSVPLRLGQVR